MGSPYMTQAVNRVNVVRTQSGFRQLLKSICGITESDWLAPIALEFVNDRRFWKEHFKDYVPEDMFSVSYAESVLWARINDCPFPWSNFSAPVVDLTVAYLGAIRDSSRVCVVIATRYETEETRLLDRVVIFDMTQRTPLK